MDGEYCTSMLPPNPRIHHTIILWANKRSSVISSFYQMFIILDALHNMVLLNVVVKGSANYNYQH